MIHSPPPPALLSATGLPAERKLNFPYQIFKTLFFIICVRSYRESKRDKINAYINLNRYMTFNRANIWIWFHLSFAFLIMTEMTPSGIKNKKRTWRLPRLEVSRPWAMDAASSSMFLARVSSRSAPAIDASWLSYTTEHQGRLCTTDDWYFSFCNQKPVQCTYL